MTSILSYYYHISHLFMHKITLVLLISSFCLAKSQLNDRVTSYNTLLEVKGYHDYSFDKLQLCDDVLIDLSKETKSDGLIRSPDYRTFTSMDNEFFNQEHKPVRTKCKWTIIAPQNQHLQLKLIDLDRINHQSRCPDDRLVFSSPDQDQLLWISLADEHKTYKYKNSTISSCDEYLQPFLTIDSNSSRVQIDYETLNSNLNFLISFNLNVAPPQTNIQICESKFLSNLSHTSLIDKNLLCNCPTLGHMDTRGEPCSYLERNFADYVDPQPLSECGYYSKLNKVCRLSAIMARSDLEPDLDQICHHVIKTKDQGWIASPSFHSKQYHNLALNCTYRIVIQPYQTVQLRFKYFHLSPGTSMLIYDAANGHQMLIANYTSDQNDFKANFYSKALNSNTNNLVIKVNIHEAPSPSQFTVYNLTYQIKGLCIENQQQCSSISELNCFAAEQRCNGVWDCHNGADERGCFGCAPDHFRCKNNIFCYKFEDRCDGDHQCVDKSDELDCDKWTCNSANGTFLCRNGRCIYEQWVCDGTNDCEDNSDELNCPSGLGSRRVITTAVLGGTLCSLLLVMALGCACKLYTLHTATHRGSFRFARTPGRPAALVQSRRRRRQRHRGGYNLSSFMRRLRAESGPVAETEASEAGEAALSPHHSLAPPTYNQTMGLVDEYEQRQLAFIEHVRSILSQQQQQQQQPSAVGATAGAQVTSMTIVPGSSAGMACRVNNRRTHRHRHHRGTAEDSRHRRRHRQSVNSSQASFDMNRRGLTESQGPSSQLTSIGEEQQRLSDLNQAPKTVNPSSANLRDKIAKLIKDIVVHHGDSISYVQLADARSSNANQLQTNEQQQQHQQHQQQPNTSQNSNSSEDDVPLIQP